MKAIRGTHAFFVGACFASGLCTAATVSSFNLSSANVSTLQAEVASKKSLCGAVDPAAPAGKRYRQARERRQCLELLRSETATRMATFGSNAPFSEGKALEADIDANIAQARDEEESEWGEKAFIGLNWGIGAGYSFGHGPTRVETADVVNNVVRISSDKTDHAIAVLESHYLFESKRDRLSGWGPFVSLQSGGGDAPVSFGAGLMFGWKDKNTDEAKAAGWLLGVGYEWADDVQVLGDGIVANEPLPTGETEIRFKKRSAGALIVIFSRKFQLSGPPK